MLIRWNEKGRWGQDFLLSPQVVWELPLRRTTREVAWFRVWNVWRWLSQCWLVFVLLGVDATRSDGVGFSNHCTVSSKWNVSRIILRIYGWVYKTLKLFPLVVEYSVAVMSARLNSMGSQFLILVLWNLRSESSVGTNFWDPIEDSDTGGPSSFTIRMEYVFAFHYWYCDLCVEGRKHCWVDFRLFAVLELSLDEGWWGGAKVLFRASWTRIFFKPGF